MAYLYLEQNAFPYLSTRALELVERLQFVPRYVHVLLCLARSFSGHPKSSSPQIARQFPLICSAQSGGSGRSERPRSGES